MPTPQATLSILHHSAYNTSINFLLFFLRSRQDIALWKEHQLQVEREERRIKSTLDDTPDSPKVQQSRRQKRESSEETKSEPASHLGRKIGGVKLCDIWSDTAEVLLRLVRDLSLFI